MLLDYSSLSSKYKLTIKEIKKLYVTLASTHFPLIKSPNEEAERSNVKLIVLLAIFNNLKIKGLGMVLNNISKYCCSNSNALILLLMSLICSKGFADFISSLLNLYFFNPSISFI